MLGANRRGNLLLIITVSAIVASLVALARPTLAQFTGLEPRRTASEGQEVGRSIPTLTANQKNAISEVIMANTVIETLITDIGQLSLNSTEFAAWTDYAGTMIGGVVTIPMSNTSLVTGEWLAIRWLNEGAAVRPYESFRFEATFENVSSILVFVDLTTNSVVGITPNKPATVVGDLRLLDPVPGQN